MSNENLLLAAKLTMIAATLAAGLYCGEKFAIAEPVVDRLAIEVPEVAGVTVQEIAPCNAAGRRALLVLAPGHAPVRLTLNCSINV